MVLPAKNRPQISDPLFQQAVDLIDAGNKLQLQVLLDAHPHLLSDAAEEDGSFAGAYFAAPRLMWFIAENPIRNGCLPDNIAAIVKLLIDAGKKYLVVDLVEQMNYTLALVMSGAVARESGQQAALCRTLIDGGAAPNSGMQAALAHKEAAACELLLEHGAVLTLPLAAGLGKESQVAAMLKQATLADRQAALSLAAINAQAGCVKQLLNAGADPNVFNPPGMHAHSTPLHQAVSGGSIATVAALIAGGANSTIKDTLFHADCRDWAKHAGHLNLLELFAHSDATATRSKASTRDTSSNAAATKAIPTKPQSRSSIVARVALAIVVLVLIVFVYRKFSVTLTLAGLADQETHIRDYQLRHPWLAYNAAVLAYIVVAGLSLPGAVPLTLVIAWLFGFWRGLLIVSFGSTAGATVAFLLSRYLLRKTIQARFGDRLKGVNDSLRQEGPFYLFTLRLIPAIPFFVINVVMGLTALRVFTFWWVSQLGMLPGTAVYVYAGAQFPDLNSLAKNGAGGILSPPLIFAFVMLGLFPFAVRKIMAVRSKPM